ncbi:efflux RND transporter periplasmic adaptor subunit [Shewanella pneumatophori]|uniref:Efflux RND transporter periplasmic adaptor subunit n=1 Tax=Shewanella pneumatophori TaxID=314092 RepID=A0A9X1ZA93_9GAMM|nr:efflux RND transporter periplasmic adaptor subunit [Shewanella pneumatophori]MCL1137903.1 efflux RND transporter periplasmic adaptor subunit [Shewanella pneumatophori]
MTQHTSSNNEQNTDQKIDPKVELTAQDSKQDRKKTPKHSFESASKWPAFYIAMIGIIGCTLIAMTAPATAVKPEVSNTINVNTISIYPTSFTPSYNAYGTVIADNKLTLSAQVDGQLDYLSSNIVEGGVVLSNELIYQQDSSDLNALLSQRQAQWQIALAQLSLEQGEQRIAQKDYQMMQQDFKDNNWQIDIDLLLRQPQLSRAKAELDIAKNALAIAERDLERSRWVSKQHYIVESKNATQGDYLNKGDKIASLVDISQLRVPFYLPRDLAQQLQLGQKITLSQPDTNQSFEATISHIVPFLDGSSQLQKVFAHYQPYSSKPHLEQAKGLIIGDFVKAKVDFKTIQNTVKLPLAAIDDAKVWLVTPANTLQSRAVNIVHQDEGHAIIANVFTPQERIVTSKLHRPQVGLSVNVVESF